MQIISTDKTLKKNTVNDTKVLNNQILATHFKKREQLVSVMPAIKKAFDLMTDNIVDLSTENNALQKKIGSYDEKCFEKTKAKLLKQIDDEKKNKFNYI